MGVSAPALARLLTTPTDTPASLDSSAAVRGGPLAAAVRTRRRAGVMRNALVTSPADVGGDWVRWLQCVGDAHGHL